MCTFSLMSFFECTRVWLFLGKSTLRFSADWSGCSEQRKLWSLRQRPIKKYYFIGDLEAAVKWHGSKPASQQQPHTGVLVASLLLTKEAENQMVQNSCCVSSVVSGPEAQPQAREKSWQSWAAPALPCLQCLGVRVGFQERNPVQRSLKPAARHQCQCR